MGLARAQTSYRLTFAAPIGKSPDAEANPLSLTGLGNDATAEFAVSKLFLFKRYEDSALLKYCADNGVAPGSCSDQAFTDPEKRKVFIGIAIRERPTLVSFSAEVGAPAFEYRNPATLENIDRKLTAHKITASYALLFLPDNLLSINLTHSRSYSASKDTTSLCTPLSDSSVAGALRCDDVTLGEPNPNDVWGLTFEFRHQIVSDNVPMFGLSPRVNLDLDVMDRSSLEVPVYFLQKAPTKESGASLNGGVTTGWSKKAGYVVKVFIGAGFQLISR